MIGRGARLHGWRRLPRILADRSGVSLVEFALVSPALLLTVMGIFDIGYNIYTATQLHGAVQKAARDSTIQGADGREAAIDGAVTRAVHRIVPQATLAFQRKSYATFSDVSQPEDFTDSNADGICNDGEPYEDANENGTWDSDRGTQGMGGARDAVLYTITIEYPRAFPLGRVIGIPDTQRMVAETVLRNQPYGQQSISVVVGNCTV